MSQSIRINCGSTEGLADLLRLLVVNTDCTEYLDCDNKDDSIESIVKRLVSETEEGQLALNVCGCPDAPDIMLTYQSIYVPWNMMRQIDATDTLIVGADFCEETGLLKPYIGILLDLPGATIPYAFSVILPRELTTGTVIVTPLLHIVTAITSEGDIDLVMKLDITEHLSGEPLGTLTTSLFSTDTYAACDHLILTGNTKTIANCSPQDILHCSLTVDAANTYIGQIAITGIELVFTQSGTIGSDTILI